MTISLFRTVYLTHFTQEKHGGLVSKDGSFLCAPDHAVEIAYMVSNLESVIDNSDDGREALDIFRDYCVGRLDIDDVNKILFEEWPECFPGLTQKEDKSADA